MLFVDTSFVIHSLAQGNVHMSDDTMILSVLEYITNATNDDDVVVCMDGIVSADLLEKRRRSVFARSALMEDPIHKNNWNTNLALPGSDFSNKLRRVMGDRGWCVVSHGASVAAIARRLREMMSSLDSYRVIARVRDAKTIAALCSNNSYVHQLSYVDSNVRGYAIVRTDPESNLEGSRWSDAVVLDILCQGGCDDGIFVESTMAQDLPGLPRMPDSSAADALRRAYHEWHRESHDRKITRKCLIDGVEECILDRESLGDVLACYMDSRGGENDDRTSLEVWSTRGWRTRHAQRHFPHGFDDVCVQYLDAIDRELSHMGGYTMCHNCSTYVHAYAPSAFDLVNHIVSTDNTQRHRSLASFAAVTDVTSWSLEMQLMAVSPLNDKDVGLPRDIKSDLRLGCVHMFPSTFDVWWGKYALLPAFDFAAFDLAYKMHVSV